MEVPRRGIQLELQRLAYTTVTATHDPSRICDLYHSLWQCWILNSLNEARDQTHILMDTSWVCYHWTTKGTSKNNFYFIWLYGFRIQVVFSWAILGVTWSHMMDFRGQLVWDVGSKTTCSYIWLAWHWRWLEDYHPCSIKGSPCHLLERYSYFLHVRSGVPDTKMQVTSPKMSDLELP